MKAHAPRFTRAQEDILVSGPEESSALAASSAVAASDAAADRPGEARPVEMPLPRNRQALLLAGIFGLLLIYSLYFARDMAIPVVFAVILHFALEPVMRSLVRLHIPRVLAGLLVILAFLACVAGFAMTLSTPAADWIAKAP
ncbi:MAG TPA: hypothetical protein VN710_01625, partial [Verrucomicrobiae bacterium]|nr:hypothetical protein [Verrucomicrobiae bacterium]